MAIVLAGLLMGGLWATVPTNGEPVSVDGGEGEPETTTMSDDERPVEVEVDCDRRQVVFTAPEEYRYDATVLVANLTATTNKVTRSTIGSLEGNETVEFTEEGIVFVFVQGQSNDEQIVASDVTNCSTNADGSTTVTPDDAEPVIRIDCAENDVQFTGVEGREYVAKVVVVAVSPTRSSTRSVTHTLEGNATISVDEEALVAAFASTGEIGDNQTVSVIRNCSPYGHERVSDNESSTENQDNGLGKH